jgi:hypothetical protein
VLAAGAAYSGPGGGAAEPLDGATAGNSPEALPPGLSVVSGVGADTPTGLSAGTVGSLAPTALAGARMVTDPDARGLVGREAALMVAVSSTAEAVVVEGMVTWACSCRAAALSSTGPSVHVPVPSLWPQPELNPGVPAPFGLASSRTVAAATLPPSAHAATDQVATCPASLLDSSGMTSTHRLTDCTVSAVSTAARAGPVAAAASATPVLAGAEADGDPAAESVGEAEDGVGAGVDVLGVGVAGDGDEAGSVVVVVVADGDDDEPVVVGEDDGDGEVVLGVGVAVGEALADGAGGGELLAADGLGDAVATSSGSHDWAGVGVAPAAAAVPAVAASAPAEAAASRTPLAVAVTTGRIVRARRMSASPVLVGIG